MVQVLAYHATDRENVASIRERGIEARLTCEHNYEWIDEQPRGVYMLPQGYKTETEQWGVDGVLCGRAVVVLNVLGLKLHPDALIREAVYCPHDLPPERIVAIVEPMEYEGPEEWPGQQRYAPFDELRYAA